jgi:hypothetical protein
VLGFVLRRGQYVPPIHPGSAPAREPCGQAHGVVTREESQRYAIVATAVLLQTRVHTHLIRGYSGTYGR